MALLLICSACNPLNQQTKENYTPGTCKAEIFAEDGNLGIRILDYTGNMDLEADIDVSFKVSGYWNTNDYHYEGNSPVLDPIREEVKETFEYKSPIYGKLHITKGQTVNMVKIDDLFLRGNKKPSWIVTSDGSITGELVPAVIEAVNAVGTIKIYRTKTQQIKENLSELDIDVTLSLSDPVNCSLDLSVNNNALFISCSDDPQNLAAFAATINGKVVPVN